MEGMDSRLLDCTMIRRKLEGYATLRLGKALAMLSMID